MNTRILFLYISASSGHQRAADAIREAMSIVVPSWDTVGVDAFTYAYPTIGRVISRTYLEMLRRTPQVWDLIYDNPDVEMATREARELLNLISAPKMKRLVQRNSPSAIVCTQAVPCSVFAAEKRRGRLPIPLIAVVTDFAVHSYWVYPEVDLYCVPSEEVRKSLIKRGIHAARIEVTGLPIHPLFLQRSPRRQARSRLKLDAKRPTILIMGGSQGMGPMQELIDRLAMLDLQILVVTGMNRSLYRTLSKQYARSRSIRVYGFTHLIHDMMDAADLLITKPGGLTSSEALAKGLPMIISNPIPGQEERNAAYLVRQGVAERADAVDDAVAAASSLVRDPLKWRRMAERTHEIARPYAAIDIARHIYRLTVGASSK